MNSQQTQQTLHWDRLVRRLKTWLNEPPETLHQEPGGWRVSRNDDRQPDEGTLEHAVFEEMLANTGSEICTVVPKPRPGFVERLLHSDYTPRKYRIVCAVVREYGTHGPEHTIRVAAHLVWGLPIRRGSMVLLERDLVAPRVPADDIRFAQVTRINGRPNETTLSVKWRRNRDEAEERETEPPWPLPRQKPASDTAPQNGTATRLAKLWVSNQPGEVQITTGDNESALFSLTTLQIVTEASISMRVSRQ